MIDEIIMTIYEYDTRIKASALEKNIAQNFEQYFDYNHKQCTDYYHMLEEDMETEHIVIKKGAVIGLTELGREMAKKGGYTKYKVAQKTTNLIQKFILYTYYITTIIGTFVMAKLINFSKSYEVSVPPMWMLLLMLIIGGLIRDALPRISKIIAKCSKH
jgi:hypothetical protein